MNARIAIATRFLIDSERIWCELEPLLDMYDRAKVKSEKMAKDILKLSRAYAAALDRERRAS